MNGLPDTIPERLAGQVTLAGQGGGRAIRLQLTLAADRMVAPGRTVAVPVRGTVSIDDRIEDAATVGELRVSRGARRWIAYRLDFQAAGQQVRLEGRSSWTRRRPQPSAITLPFTLTCGSERIGEGRLALPRSSDLLRSLATRSRGDADEGARALAPRWDGAPGRTEVWYTTITDPVTGTGVWLHHELVAPDNGSSPYTHGWAALFPPNSVPIHARFGPSPWTAASPEGFATTDALAGPGRLRGVAGAFSWHLEEEASSGPLYTFPRWAWRRALLPAAHMLPAASATYSGTIAYPGGTLQLRNAPGASARIYGHGNARRWAWLHAALPDGHVLEIVAAVAVRPGLRRLSPMVFLKLHDPTGHAWPRGGLRTALGRVWLDRFRAHFAYPRWTVTGRAGMRRIRVEVTMPAERTLALDYTDPDGAQAVCRNSEVADARIVLERWRGRWHVEADWDLVGRAHAEMGDR